MKIAALEMPTVLGEDNRKAQKAFVDGYNSIDADIFVAPEYLWGKGVSESGLADIVAKFDKSKIAIPGTIMNEQNDGTYNTAFVISEGKIIHKYNKETSSQENSSVEDYRTGNNASYSTKVLNKKLGIEICRDHGMGRLKRKEQSVDLQLIIANNMNISPAKLINKEYAIIVDGNKSAPYSGVLDKQAKWLQGKKINNFTIYEV